MTTPRDEGLAVLKEMLPDLFADHEGDASASARPFAPELGDQAMETVFARLWLRPGLDRRSRSLLTIGMLIGLGSHDELGIHFRIGLNNGLSVEELEEIIYHASGYAGFPAASTAAHVARQALAVHDTSEQEA